jgi:hypothetical protein
VLDSANGLVGTSKSFEAIHSQVIREGLAKGLVEGVGKGVPEGLVEGLLEGLVEGVPKPLAKGLPQPLRNRVAKGFVKALALAWARARVTTDNGQRTTDNGQRTTDNGLFCASDEAQSQPPPPPKKPRKPRRTDALWDALVDAGLPKPTTSSAEANWSKVTNDLLTIGATPEQVRERVAEYRRRWPAMELTVNAIHKHWDALAIPAAPAHPPSAFTGRVLTDRGGPSIGYVPEEVT